MSHRIREAAHAGRTDFLRSVQSLVDFESPTQDKDAADRLSVHLESLLKNCGWTVERHAQQEVGDHLVAHLDAPGNIATAILTHYDTVWPVGTLRAMPFRVEDDKAYGPGILDMKAGIVTGITAVELVRQSGLKLRGPVTMLLTSDEETGSETSRALIESVCLRQQRALVVEPGTPDGGLKNCRKAVGSFDINFQGISAHAGNNPQAGASALRELANFLYFAEGLTDHDRGTSVNVTVAHAGTVSNVIAESATAEVDFRALTTEEAERVVAAITSYRPHDTRVRVEINGGLNRPPLEFTERNELLYNEAVAAGGALGIPISGTLAGGGSDGNFTSAIGVPTLDGLGPVGVGPHARHEHIDIPSTLDRVALLTYLLSS